MENNDENNWYEIMCKKSRSSQMFVECEGKCTKPNDVANHFNNFFITKVEHLRSNKQSNDVNLTCNSAIRLTTLPKEIKRTHRSLNSFEQYYERENMLSHF